MRRLTGPMAEFVESVWVYASAPGPWRRERILPSGRAQLIVNLKEDETRSYSGDRVERRPGTVVSGIGTKFQVIDAAEQEEVAGVVFRPGGTMGFFGVPAPLLRDESIPVAALWGERAVARLRERLLETTDGRGRLAVLEQELGRVWTARELHPAVAYALRELERDPGMARIGSMADAAGLSQRRFGERFRQVVGVSPKRYCRLLRFRRAVLQAHGMAQPDWSRVALECGYFDQAHFIHDFREFSGITPGTYEELRTAYPNHVGS